MGLHIQRRPNKEGAVTTKNRITTKCVKKVNALLKIYPMKKYMKLGRNTREGRTHGK